MMVMIVLLLKWMAMKVAVKEVEAVPVAVAPETVAVTPAVAELVLAVVQVADGDLQVLGDQVVAVDVARVVHVNYQW